MLARILHPRENHPRFPEVRLRGTHVIDLKKLGIDSDDQLIVSLPWSYDQDSLKKHPVVYVFDAYWDFCLMWGLYSKLLDDKEVPEYILVGLSYSRPLNEVWAIRERDQCPPEMGSDYLQRIQQRIIPFVESEYPADPAARFLCGISTGGLVALESLFSAPDLFHGVVALGANPALFDGWLRRSEETFYKAQRPLKSLLLGHRPKLPARVFMGFGGLDHPELLKEASAFNQLLDQRNYLYLEKQFRVIEGEKHVGVYAEGMNRGLRHLFANESAKGKPQ